MSCETLGAKDFLEMIGLSTVKAISTVSWAGFLSGCMLTSTILAILNVGLRFGFFREKFPAFAIFANTVDFFSV